MSITHFDFWVYDWGKIESNNILNKKTMSYLIEKQKYRATFVLNNELQGIYITAKNKNEAKKQLLQVYPFASQILIY